MKNLIFIITLFSLSCTHAPVKKSNVVYLSPEKQHHTKEAVEWTKRMIQDAKDKNINLFLEGYFPETKLSKNVYGVDDPLLAGTAVCFVTYIDVEFLNTSNVYAMNNINEYVQSIKRQYYMFDEAKALVSMKEKLSYNPKHVKDVFEFQQFCADFLNDMGKTSLSKYQYIFDALTVDKNIGEEKFIIFWDEVAITKRDEKMVENFMKKRDSIANNKDNVIIIGLKHLPGMGKLLVEKGFDVRVLKSKDEK